MKRRKEIRRRGIRETNVVVLVRGGKKAWARDWRPFFIQSGSKQIVGIGITMGAVTKMFIAS
jgi:hypothetical protein